MSETDLLVDFTNDAIPADKGLRFANFIIDIILFYAISFIIGILMAVVAPSLIVNENGGASILLNVIIFIVYVLYFTVFEGLTNGKTLGKLITKTRAVKEDGSPITFADAFKRSLSRLVPFEPLSAFGDRLWHDKWTKTIVIKENRL